LLPRSASTAAGKPFGNGTPEAARHCPAFRARGGFEMRPSALALTAGPIDVNCAGVARVERRDNERNDDHHRSGSIIEDLVDLSGFFSESGSRADSLDRPAAALVLRECPLTSTP